MTIRTVTYDDATHRTVPLEATDEIGEAMLFNNGGMKGKYAAAIAAAPPFTSLPNPDLDLIEKALNLAAGLSLCVTVSEYEKIKSAIAALKRLKGGV